MLGGSFNNWGNMAQNSTFVIQNSAFVKIWDGQNKDIRAHVQVDSFKDKEERSIKRKKKSSPVKQRTTHKTRFKSFKKYFTRLLMNSTGCHI